MYYSNGESAEFTVLPIIKSKRKLLDKVSEALLKKETIDRDEFEKIVGKK